MAVRRPLVIDANGKIEELPTADTFPVGSLGSFAVSNGVVYFNGTALVNDADLKFDGSKLSVGDAPFTQRLNVKGGIRFSSDSYDYVYVTMQSITDGANTIIQFVSPYVGSALIPQPRFIGTTYGSTNQYIQMDGTGIRYEAYNTGWGSWPHYAAHYFNTNTAVTDADHRLARFDNNSTEKAFFSKDGFLGIGLGANNAAAAIHAIRTSTQQRLGYSGSVYEDSAIDSSGQMVRAITGSAPEQVRSDPYTFNASVKRKCGTGTQYAKVGGKIADFLDDYVSTVTEADAYAKSIVANSLGTNGDQLEFEFNGIFAANNNLKYLKVVFAGTTIWDSGDISQNGGSWIIRGTIMRQNSTTVKYAITTTFLAADISNPPQKVDSVGSLTFSTAYDLKLRADSDVAGDLTAKFGWVKWQPAA